MTITAQATIGQAAVADGVVLQVTRASEADFYVVEKADACRLADAWRSRGYVVCFMPERVVAEHGDEWWIGIRCASVHGVSAWGRAKIDLSA